MSLSATEFRQLLDESAGGSEERYLHPVNQEFTFTSGVFNALRPVNGRWFVDLVAEQLAPLYAKAWLENNASIGIVILQVFGPAEHSDAARVTLSLKDGEPPAFTEMVAQCEVPEGVWTFYLGTDTALRAGNYITNLYLPQEH